ncbi:hypothetical protein BaRGS_00027584 [Batillaria attramentaria]|uniref:Calcineurin-like phosphoesterase domain-containing protein n=1 Tax=Batillaria attramentaria TaxID=370345 RepID=A0ABD0K2C2_9CAEN
MHDFTEAVTVISVLRSNLILTTVKHLSNSRYMPCANAFLKNKKNDNYTVHRLCIVFAESRLPRPPHRCAWWSKGNNLVLQSSVALYGRAKINNDWRAKDSNGCTIWCAEWTTAEGTAREQKQTSSHWNVLPRVRLVFAAVPTVCSSHLRSKVFPFMGSDFIKMTSTAKEASSGSVAVHPCTCKPNKAWDKIKVKQTVTKVTPLSPDTPVRDDHLRFVCISDTHTQIEKLGLDFVPPGDVLLHGGDFSNVGLPKDIKNFNEYLGRLPHKRKVVIAGNHDLTMDLEMVRNSRQYLERNFSIREKVFEEYLKQEGVENSRQLLTNCIYLEDSGVEICGVKIYGSPWQPEFGGWGFNLDRGAPLLEYWNKIPSDTDILITHGPPVGYGDLCFSGLRAGCVELLTTIQQRVKPRYHLCGHIHEDYGVTSDGYTTFINASTCTLRYKPVNPPVVFDFPIPEGHTKEELSQIPHCNL